MNNIKSEFVNAIMISLKIEKNPFIVSTIDEFTKDIHPANYKAFMTALFGSQHAYLNGIDRVAKVAETFKEVILEVDHTEIKAKELIDLVKGMNESIYRDSEHMEVTFDDLLEVVKFPTVCKDDVAILSQVKPFNDMKLLIKNINTYQTTMEAIRAFKSAIELSGNSEQLSYEVNKMLK